MEELQGALARARRDDRRTLHDAQLPGPVGDPRLKITDQGLIDVERFEIVPLEIEP